MRTARRSRPHRLSGTPGAIPRPVPSDRRHEPRWHLPTGEPAARPAARGQRPAPRERPEQRGRRLVPFLFDAVAARLVAVQRRQEPEQATVGVVAQAMAAHLGALTDLQRLLGDAVVLEPARVGGLERPELGFTFVVLHFHVYPRMGVEEMNLLDRPLDDGEVTGGVVVV